MSRGREGSWPIGAHTRPAATDARAHPPVPRALLCLQAGPPSVSGSTGLGAVCPTSAPPAAPHTRHADALELPDLVQAGGVILTRVRDALVDVDLAARAGVALQAPALEGAQCVDALALVLTGVGTWGCNAVRGCSQHPSLQPSGRDLPASPISPGTLRGQSVPSEHSSTSWLQAGPMYPEGQVQMALPLTGLVSQLEPSLQGLLMQASLRWQSRPGRASAVSGHCLSPRPRPYPTQTH